MNRRKNHLSFVSFRDGVITFERQFTCRSYKLNSLRKGIKICKILVGNGFNEILRLESEFYVVYAYIGKD